MPGSATATPISPNGVAVASDGDVYVADDSNFVVEKITPSGTLSIVAGVPGRQGSPAPGPATKSYLNQPVGLALDSAGNLYIADAGEDVVDKVTPSGTLSVVAGIPGVSGAPTPGPATSSDLGAPDAVTVSSGNLYITDANINHIATDVSTSNLVEKVTAAGTLSIVAGVYGQSGTPTPGPATSSTLNDPDGVAVNSGGDVFVADSANTVIEEITPSGTLSVIAGTPGMYNTPTPGPAVDSDLDFPQGLAIDGNGNLYVSDSGNNEVEEITSSGTLSILAGDGDTGTPTPGPANSSALDQPDGVAVDSAGDVYIADQSNNEVEKVNTSGTLSVIAGDGPVEALPTPGAATSSALSVPNGVAVDSNSGDVYIADYGNEVVEKVTPSGTLSIVAGVPGAQGEPTPGPATSSDLYAPYGVAVDSSGDLYIADADADVVEKVTPSGTLSIVAGVTGQSGNPTAGPATSADLNFPNDVAVDSSGDLFIADSENNVVEEVTPSGTLSIVAGVVAQYGPPTPGPATSSDLDEPTGVAVDSAGNLYIADSQNNVVEEVTNPGTSGTLSILGTAAGAAGIAVDGSGNVYVSTTDDTVEKLTESGATSIVAGIYRDSGPPTPGPSVSSAVFAQAELAVDSSGNLYIADSFNRDVEEVFDAADASGAPSDLTATSLTCSPLSLTGGAATTCTATVKDTAAYTQTTPSGTVSFVSSSTTGAFSHSGECNLVATGVTGVATCAVTFTPAATGSYAITPTYEGNGTQIESSGEPSTITATVSSSSGSGGTGGSSSHSSGGGTSGSPASPRGSGSIKVGGVRGSTVTETLICAGTSDQSCTFTETLTVVEALRGRTLVAVAASAHTKSKRKLVTVGSKTVTFAGGHSETVKLTLNGTGAALLKKRGSLPVELTIKQSQQTLHSQELTLKRVYRR